ncbi:putative glyoxal oxidase [Xylariomycetidae sp. FL2044]|nr:putative glyoxal oxidase [Xylariomycetidae sp. FL2044]
MRATRAYSFLSSLSLLSFTGLSSAQLVVPSPKELNGTWAYQGCYTDVGRTIEAAFTLSQNLTTQSCLNFCQSRSYPYAGTEYFRECYCGLQLVSTTKKVNETTDCTTPCAGNNTQPCGGPSRLSLFYNQYIVGPQPNTGVPDWPHIGCYSEGNGGRALTYGAPVPAGQMNAANCTAACFAAGYVLAGTEYSGECYCGNSIANGGSPATDGCSMKCNGNQSEICGGPNRLNVYDYKMSYPVPGKSTSLPVTSSTTPAPSLNTSSSVPPSSATSSPSTTPPAITSNTTTTPSTTSAGISSPPSPLPPITSSTSATPSTSSVFNSSSPDSPPVVTSSTSFSTSSTDTRSFNATSFSSTGGGSDIASSTTAGSSIASSTSFTAPVTNTTTPSTSFTASLTNTTTPSITFTSPANSTAPSTSFTAPVTNTTTPSTSSVVPPTNSISTSTTSSSPSSSPFPSGWTYQGCWQDGPNGRIMNTYQDANNPNLTQQSCAQLCKSKGYSVSGTEYYTQCFCSNAIYNGGRQGDPSKCTTPCGGDSTQMCGGPGYLTIWSNGPPQTYQPPVPQTSGLNGTWTYQGCYQDNVNNSRVLPWTLRFPTTNTASVCLGQCASFGYTAAGMEYGQECYCGDPADIINSGSTQRPESECGNVCAGNASAICGGGQRLSMYYWTGQTPLFSFSYPQGTDAGTYSNLVGGVVTPLMTMQSITGKVTFLEKAGTGAPNSTGAYELDLSQVGNFSNAWRTLHLKTDVFCSAGLILPDKAGRQLTVGGWSLDSTFGVRLYTPDGSPGVKGKNDWQENNQLLRLQVGRWYPGSIVMANGSILVVGGEHGSNDRAEPTLEVLPRLGPLVYADWLARTDPNNLYPFLSVLPGGGILVAYWNEARILDETTFNTIKTLPNMPGAVSDPLGGRTYPLEGTAVLLPQYAPYTDPLGVLLCGGSTTGGNALDNCISTYPEVPNPTWTLERMPSKRVMTCMAPLPDGTYLIANGAKQGVAGFGLADFPNYNAVLYDPTKPVGARMSVMANTSVARLYHSEAITLLDGRVLITGSDPQDPDYPEELRVEVFTPPYLYSSRPRPSFNVSRRDWAYGDTVPFTLGAPPPAGAALRVSLLGAVSSTHGNSFGARTIFPAFSCSSQGGGVNCVVTAPPNNHVAPPGWFQMFVLQDGIPAVGVYVRLGGDPGALGNWPNVTGFTVPGV